LDIEDLTDALATALGKDLLAIMVENDARAISGWIDGTSHPSPEDEATLRTTFKVLELITTKESPSVARAWFMDMNPNLDDNSPAEAIANGQTRSVVAAARAFVNS
jgi:hypothetical protein